METPLWLGGLVVGSNTIPAKATSAPNAISPKPRVFRFLGSGADFSLMPEFYQRGGNGRKVSRRYDDFLPMRVVHSFAGSTSNVRGFE